MKLDPLGTRMKEHEGAVRQTLPRRTWTLLRVDGRAFGGVTRHLERPFDALFAADMDRVAAALCAEASGTAFAYVQSDEISLLLTDFAAPGTQPWFGGNVNKMVSLSAALATGVFNRLRPTDGPPALFDSRVFTVPSASEAAAYFVWRQRDAVKNSVSMTAQAAFPHKRLQGLHSGQMRELLVGEAGIDWDDQAAGFRHGRVVTRETFSEPVTFTHRRSGETHTQDALRTRWVSAPAPVFAGTGGWLAEAIPALPLVATG